MHSRGRQLSGLARGLGFVALLACGRLAGAAGWNSPIPLAKLPSFEIPRIAQAPTIDGKIDPREWQEAVAISGVGGCVSGELIARPTTFYLAWDKDHLYMAIRTWVKPNYKPSVSGRAPGTAACFDDSGEFHFKPMGGNVMPVRTDSSYKWNINCLGLDGDLQRVAVGQQFKNWQPTFTTVARMTEPGSAPQGGRWWECEWMASTQDFELTGPNQPGDKWRFMLGFNHMYSGWTQARIPAMTSYFDPGGYPVATLVEKAPAIQMTMDDLPGPLDGVAAVRISAFNPTEQAVQLKVTALYADEKGEPILMKEAPLAVAPGKSAAFALNEKLARMPQGQTPGSITFTVAQSDRTLYHYFTFFKAGYPADAMAPAQPRKEAFPLQATFNPAASNLMFAADSYYLDHPENVREVKYQIARQGEAKTLAEGTIDRAITNYYRRLIQLPALAEGTYLVEARMITRDGTVLGPEKATFVKKDEAKEYGDWWNTALGNTERVIRPFEPMTRRSDRVSMWGRTYQLNALGLPREIISQGRKLSAGESRIVAVINGKEEVIALKGEPEFTETKDWRVAFTGKAKGAGLAFSVKGKVEQDGMTQLELTYAPEGRAPVSVDALRIEFPLTAEQSECLLCLGTGGNYAARTTTLLPPGQGRVWSTLDTGRNGSGMTVGNFYPIVWLGSDLRGFLWAGDSDRGWVPVDDRPAHEVIRVKDTVILRNNLISQTFTLDAPRTVRLNYIATPFRPLVKGWRASIHSEDGTFEGPHKKRKDPKTGQEVMGWNWVNPPSKDPGEWSSLWAEFKKIADEKVRREQPFSPAQARRWMYVHTSLPLMGYGWKSPDERVTGYFGPDWEGDSWNKTEQDYFLWLCDRAFREGGLRTIYWDIFFIATFNTIQNGLAYELPDGRIQPGFNMLNLRQFMMRLQSVMQDNGLTPGGLMSHATNDYCLAAAPWMDAILDGEYHSISDTSGMDWVDGYPIERMRALSVSENFGSQISWMNLIAIEDKAKRDHANRGFIEWPRMFDTWTGPNGADLPAGALVFDLNEAPFIPFWRNPYVTCEDKDVLVSLWPSRDRTVLMVFNYDRAKVKDVEIRVDLTLLKLAPQQPELFRVLDLDKGAGEPESTFDLASNTLRVPALQPHTGRVIGLRVVEKKALATFTQQFQSVRGTDAKYLPSLCDQGMVSAKTRFLPSGQCAAVTSADADISVAVWQLPDRVLLVANNGSAKDSKDAQIAVDLAKLNLVPQLVWQEFIRAIDVRTGNNDPPASLDFYGGRLTLPRLAPGATRMVVLRRF